MNNIEKAAILLNNIGEPYSSNIIKFLDKKETNMVVQAMAEIEKGEVGEIQTVISELLDIRKSSIYSRKGMKL